MEIREIGPATLILGDAVEVLPDLEGIAAIIADPPYGINFCHSGHHGKGFTSVKGLVGAVPGAHSGDGRGARPALLPLI